MKGRVIYCHYDEDTKQTSMCKHTKYGTFKAKTVPTETDIEVANKWTGGRLAEYKCDLQAVKRKYNMMNDRANGIEIAIKNIKSRPNTLSEDSFKMIKLFEKQAIAMRKDADYLKESYEILSSGYNEYAEREIKNKKYMLNRELDTPVFEKIN